MKGKISILVSSWGMFPDHLAALYNSSVSAFRKRIGREQEFLLRVDDDLLKVEIQSLHSLYDTPALIHLLEAGRWDSAADKLQHIFEELERKWAESQEHLLEVYFFSVSSAYASIAHKKRPQAVGAVGRRLRQAYGKCCFPLGEPAAGMVGPDAE